jgi:DNA-binding CsgD family transcriptional regulator
MEGLNETQLSQALSAAYELAELHDLAEFPACAAHLLTGLIPCEHAGYNAIDVTSGRATVVADPSEVVFAGGPEALVEFGHQNPLIVRAAQGCADVLCLSDHISRRELHRTELYDHVYRIIGLEYQLGVRLPPGPVDRSTEFVGVSLSRTHRDFEQCDRMLLRALQPLLGATLQRLRELALMRALLTGDPQHARAGVVLVDAGGAVAWSSPEAESQLALVAGESLPVRLRTWLAGERERALCESAPALLEVEGRPVRVRLVRDAYPDLDAIHVSPAALAVDAAALGPSLGTTPRQSEVLALLLEGRTSREIADELLLSTRTVEKHLEAIYARLGVHSRGQAIRATMELVAA